VDHATFLDELGVGLEELAVPLLTRLAGAAPCANRPPGKATLARGLRRLLDYFVVEDFLRRERERGPLPPQIEAFQQPRGQPS
jgi:hypothetical protein